MNVATICFASVMASVAASAQAPSPSHVLRHVVFERTRAFLEGDSDTYRRYTAARFLSTKTDGTTHICAPNIQERIPREEAFFEILDLKIKVEGETASVGYRLVVFESREEGSPYYFARRTENYVRNSDGWKLVAEREVEIPDRLY